MSNTSISKLFRVRRLVRSVANIWYIKLFESHDIASEGAGLVREEVLNLAEFLVKVAAIHLSWHIFVFIVHLNIPNDVRGLKIFDHLKSDDERNWYEVGE